MKQLLITIDLESEVPIYQQVRNEIVEGIASGKLQPGDALPSVRVLASDLGVNMHTVNKVYQILKQDGFIHIHRQKGVVINPNGFPPVDDSFLESIRQQLRPIISEALCRGMDEEEFHKEVKTIFHSIQKGGIT